MSAFVFPALFHRWGESGAIMFLAGVAVLASLVTWVWIPETRRMSLEDTAHEDVGTSKAMTDESLITES